MVAIPVRVEPLELVLVRTRGEVRDVVPSLERLVQHGTSLHLALVQVAQLDDRVRRRQAQRVARGVVELHHDVLLLAAEVRHRLPPPHDVHRLAAQRLNDCRHHRRDVGDESDLWRVAWLCWDRVELEEHGARQVAEGGEEDGRLGLSRVLRHPRDGVLLVVGELVPVGHQEDVVLRVEELLREEAQLGGRGVGGGLRALDGRLRAAARLLGGAERELNVRRPRHRRQQVLQLLLQRLGVRVGVPHLLGRRRGRGWVRALPRARVRASLRRLRCRRLEARRGV
mmetsp:Transcript_24973/g.53006  ORF Transcript_24973/g.53006 Transcript_24973/m.53006 type:complete len:283 (-) Transcript_24973:14-862(-)